MCKISLSFLLALSCCSSTIFAEPCPPVESLPWINGKDEDAMYYATPFLPKNPVILEAGVCGGEDTCSFKKNWPHSIIYGFEANPDNFKSAIKNTEKLPGVKILPVALFDHVGSTIFYCSKANGGASSILKDNLRNVENIFNCPSSALNYRDVPVVVPCTTVDQWAQDNRVSKIDYIWLDAEGAEIYILQHAKSILPSVKVISIEANFQEFRKGMTLFPKLYEFLTENGFKLESIWGNSRWQGVAIFIKAEK